MHQTCMLFHTHHTAPRDVLTFKTLIFQEFIIRGVLEKVVVQVVCIFLYPSTNVSTPYPPSGVQALTITIKN